MSGCRTSSSSAAAGRALWQSVRSHGHHHLRRFQHTRRALPYEAPNGLAPLFSKQTLEMLAGEYQDGLLKQLSDQVKGTASQNASVVQTVINTAADRNQVLAFNLASEALNNSYFLSRLTPDAARSALSPSSSLYRRLKEDFGSFEAFQHQFSAAALGMSGSGYLWLVHVPNEGLGIVATFGAGTPLVQARRQRGDQDDIIGAQPQPQPQKPTEEQQQQQQQSQPSGSETYQQMLNSSHQQQQRQSRSSSSSAAAAVEVNPLLCLSVQEHAWLLDHGIWGKEEYIKHFWSFVNWARVEQTLVSLDGAAPPSYYT